jgi:hypothetical protein
MEILRLGASLVCQAGRRGLFLGLDALDAEHEAKQRIARGEPRQKIVLASKKVACGGDR